MKIRPYYAEINLDNFRHNFREVKRLAPGKKILGVIKADGYGHGAVELARVLQEENADYFVVAIISEAIEIRNNGFKQPILILGYTPPEFAEDIVRYDITQTIYTCELAEAISKAAIKLGKTAKIHIKIDTGMGRIGFLPTEKSIEEIVRISKMDNLYLEGVFSHFACSDEIDKQFTYKQLECFRSMLEKLECRGITFELRHISNSAAIIDMPDECSCFNGVRPGIILYGYYPSDEVKMDRINLKPVMSLKAKITDIKEVNEGTPISYGRKYYTKRKSLIATLPVGYADGFTRLLFEKINVIAGGKLVPVVGRICMDQCMIDITDCSNLKIGDEVVVMGESNGIKNNADDYAKALGTISYEVLCMVSRRVPRVYIENGDIVEVKNYV